jgi:hypothetical protein
MDTLESQNDDMIEGLFQKVGMLKNVSSWKPKYGADDLGDRENRGGNSRFVGTHGYHGSSSFCYGGVEF